MHLTDSEENFWPWHWTHEGRDLTKMDEHIAAFKTFDPYTDQTYNPTLYLMCNNDGHPNKRAITDHIVCNTIEPDTSEKISMRDYKAYAIEKFDQQMEKLLNKHNKVAIGLSGGIDSTMVLAWLYKNKADFDTFVVKGDTWRGYMNDVMENQAIEMTKILGVRNHVFNFSKTTYTTHSLLRHYMVADQFEFPCISYATQPPSSLRFSGGEMPFDGHLIAPIGVDDFFLHRATSWVRFIPKQLLETMKRFQQPIDMISNYGYKVGVFSPSWGDRIEQDSGRQMMHRWDDDLWVQMYGGFLSSPATSQDWWNKWHAIDEASCDQDNLKDMMSAGWLKHTVSHWIGGTKGDSVANMSKSVSCAENYYEPDQSNREYILSECAKILDRYKSSANHRQQVYWRGTVDVLKAWNKIAPEAVYGIHQLNWLEKNKK